MEALKKLAETDPFNFIEYKYHYYGLVSVRAQMETKVSDYLTKNLNADVSEQQKRIDALGEAFVYVAKLWEHAQLERKANQRLEELNLKIGIENTLLKKENEKLINTINGLPE